MMLVLEYYFIIEKIEIMAWSGRWFEKIKMNEEECPNKINRVVGVESKIIISGGGEK